MDGRHPGDWGSLLESFARRLTRLFPDLPVEERLHLADLAARRWVVAVQPLLFGLPPVAAVGRALHLLDEPAADGEVLAALAALDADGVAGCVGRLTEDGRGRLEAALRAYEHQDGDPVAAMEAELHDFSLEERVRIVAAAAGMVCAAMRGAGWQAPAPAAGPRRPVTTAQQLAAVTQLVTGDVAEQWRRYRLWLAGERPTGPWTPSRSDPWLPDGRQPPVLARDGRTRVLPLPWEQRPGTSARVPPRPPGPGRSVPSGDEVFEALQRRWDADAGASLVPAVQELIGQVRELAARSRADGPGAAAVTAALTALREEVAALAPASTALVDDVARIAGEVDQLRIAGRADGERLTALAAEISALRTREHAPPPGLDAAAEDRVRAVAAEEARRVLGRARVGPSASVSDSLLREGLDSTGGQAAVRAFDRAAGGNRAAAPAAVVPRPPRTGADPSVPPPRGPGVGRPSPGRSGPAGSTARRPPGAEPRSPQGTSPRGFSSRRHGPWFGVNAVLALIALGLAVVAGVRLGPPETAAHLPRALDPGADAGLVLLGAVLWLVVVPFWGRRTSGRFAASVVVKVLLVGVLASVTLGGAAPDLPFWSPAAAAVPYPSGPGEVQETVADFLAVPADHASLSSTEADFRAQFDERTAQLLTERLDAYPVAGDRVVAQAIGGLVAAGAVQRQASGSLGVPAGTATAAQQAAWQRLYRGLLTAHARTRASLATADPLLMAVHWELTGYVRPADRAPRAAEGMADLVRLGESVGTGPCAPGLQRSPATWQSQDGVPVDIVSRYVCPRS